MLGQASCLSAPAVEPCGLRRPLEGLLQRVAAGDKSAVKATVARYGDLVWSQCLRLLKHRDEAEDVVQEIFVELWRSAGRYDPKIASETTFVVTVARRRIYDRLRKKERTPPSVSTEVLERWVTDEAVHQVEAHSEAQLACRALTQLSQEERTVLVLASYYGLTHQEIAEHTGLPLGTVKTRARRGLIRLRGILEPAQGGVQ